MKKKYTLILIPPDHRPTRQYQFTDKGKKYFLTGSLIALLGLSALFAHDVYQYRFIKINEAEYAKVEALEQQLALKDAEINQLNEQTKQIYDNLEKISLLENQIASILKLNIQESMPRSRSAEGISRPLSSSSENSSIPFAQLTSQTLSDHVATLELYYDEALKYQDKLNHTPSILPVEGPIVSYFGYRKNPFGGWSKEFHNGVDIAVNYGTPVLATADGTVSFSGYDGAYGYKVEIDHGYGIVTFYGHNSKLLVKAGTQVKRGDVIAYSGNSGRSTGAHVHFGAYINGESVDPLMFINPTKEQ